MRVKIPENIIPVHSRMLCERVADVTSAHIVIPQEVLDTSPVFEVLAKGRTCVDDQIQVGTYVYVGKFSPCHIGFPGKSDWFIINEKDVLGVCTKFKGEAEITVSGERPGRKDK